MLNNNTLSDVQRKIKWVDKVKVILYICTYCPIYSCVVVTLVRPQLTYTATKKRRRQVHILGEMSFSLVHVKDNNT